MFQINDVIVCVDNKIWYTNHNSKTKFLTIDKSYTILSIKVQQRSKYIKIGIVNDNNMIGFYYDFRFITIQESRNNKLNKICQSLTLTRTINLVQE